MNPKIPFLLVVFLALASCDKADKLINKAKDTISKKEIKDETSPSDIITSSPIDKELAKLIDKTEEGILFRRDLPFPKDVRVTITEKEPMAVRLFRSSAIRTQNKELSSVRKLHVDMHKTQGTLRFSNHKEEYFNLKSTIEDGATGQINDHPLLPPVPPKDHTMVFRNGKWGSKENTGFAEAVLTQQLGPQMPTLLLEYGLNPRALWFGKRRIAPGKPMVISGELLPMLVIGKATGELTITLEDIESVHGHPCGRFAIKGSYQRKGFPLLDGRIFDEETSIQSGHIWMSVLHPLVLQYHLERIVTYSVPEGSGPAIRFQGNTSPMRSIEWKAEG
jgi:hypothetical protein